MAFTHATLEELLAWCASAPELRGARDEATARFVGMDDERPVSYLEGTGTLPSLQRRLMGYFMFNWRLPSGELPAEVGVKRLW
jgi:hypothetical protein